ncbi:MAG: hypothetical protein ACRD1R_08120, partial [Acidobacteriota bacterium]
LDFAVVVGAVAAVTIRLTIFLAAGNYDVSPAISPLAMLGGGVGGTALWMAKTTATGRLYVSKS